MSIHENGDEIVGITFLSAAYALPSRKLTNEELSAAFPKWSPDAILEKTGIRERRVLSDGESCAELALLAAKEALQLSGRPARDIDFLFVVTETPDYVFPATACLLQSRLGLLQTCAALDINLGCSGLVYATAVATSWITTGLGRTGLIVTADCYSRIIAPDDPTCRPLFGDAAASVVVTGTSAVGGCEAFVFGTDGNEGRHMTVEGGGFRDPPTSSPPRIRMNGPGMFAFAIRVVPSIVERCLEKAHLTKEDIDLFLFHQANAYMVNHLRTIMGLPEEKVPVSMERVGNTVSSSLLVLLVDLLRNSSKSPPATLMFVGFGVGASWGAFAYRLQSPPSVGVVDHVSQ